MLPKEGCFREMMGEDILPQSIQQKQHNISGGRAKVIISRQISRVFAADTIVV